MMSAMSDARAMAMLLGATVLLSLGVESALAEDFGTTDLSGEWYVLIHYKDERSQDKSITKFKDFAWSVKQTADLIVWESFPYLRFSDELEEVRRHAMTEHLPWEPTPYTWARIRESIRVSARASSRKRLTGSYEKGFRSRSDGGAAGMHTLTFSRDWTVSFANEAIRIEVVDSLSGTAGLFRFSRA